MCTPFGSTRLPVPNVSGYTVKYSLEGAKPAGGDAPPGPSLVAFTAGRSVDDFRRTIRTGRTPTGAGRALNPEFMPWPIYARMSDDELQAIWLYVQSLSTSTKAR